MHACIHGVCVAIDRVPITNYWLALIATVSINFVFRLRDVIVDDHFKHLGMEERFYDEFPDSVTLDQTVAVWKHIVLYQEKIKAQ